MEAGGNSYGAFFLNCNGNVASTLSSTGAADSYIATSAPGNAWNSFGLSATTTITVTGGGRLFVNVPLLNQNNNSGGNANLAALNGGGAATLISTGTGTLVLGASNMYTGGTQINGGGVVQLGSSAATLGGSTGYLAVNNGTLDMNGNSVGVGQLSGSGAITNLTAAGAGNLSVGNGVASGTSNTYSGTISSGPGTLALAMNGAGTGTQVLSGSNNYSGGTFLYGGELGFTGTAALPYSTSPPNINFLGGALKWVNNSTDLSAAIVSTTAATQNVILDINGNNVTFANGLSGLGGLTVESTTGGTLNLTAANTFSGTTSITGGTLNVAHVNALQNSTVNATVNNSVVFPSTLTTANFGALMGTGNIGLNKVALTVGGNGGSTTYGGTLSGGAGFTKTGAGTMTLTSSQAYGGPTAIARGTLQLSGAVAGTTGGTTGIGIKFDSAAAALASTDTTGVAPMAYWNNMGGTAQQTTPQALVNSLRNQSSGASVTWNTTDNFANNAGTGTGRAVRSFVLWLPEPRRTQLRPEHPYRTDNRDRLGHSTSLSKRGLQRVRVLRSARREYPRVRVDGRLRHHVLRAI